MQLGNPSGATADTNNHEHYLIQRPVEAIDYSDTLGLPNWASWDLTADDLGTNSRSTTFFTDTNLPANFYWVKTGDYTYSGYDRGHMCPSADRTDTEADNDMVFFMSNIVPQNSANNSGVWGQFEAYCRTLAQTNELLIICGPSGFSGERINTNGPVYVPTYVWKIAVVVPPGDGLAVDRITSSNRVIALKIPNLYAVTNPWPAFVTSASQIEVDTGYTFFTALPPDVAAVLRNKVDGQTNPPPAIVSFTPDDGSVNTTVLITGTNLTGASAVTFNGLSASFTVDSNEAITAYVPTNAGSGFISVTTPSGTAISSNAFVVLNHGGSVYSGVIAGWDMSSLSGGANNYGPSPFSPTTNGPHLLIGGLTRGTGVTQSGTAAAGGWGGTGFTSTNAASAIMANQFATLSLTASNGYTLSLLSLSRFDYRCSTTGPTNGVIQYQVGNGGFFDITNVAYSSDANGATNPPMDLSGVAALQNIAANTPITLRIVNYGGTNATGKWYIYDKLGSPAPDFTIQGTVTEIVTNPPASPPVLSSIVVAANQIQFSVGGTTGANYVVEATTSLNPPDWLPVATNAAPFVFTDTNVNLFLQRFYRGRALP
jgi:DNA/RNA endonuclease G (NUC1)